MAINYPTQLDLSFSFSFFVNPPIVFFVFKHSSFLDICIDKSLCVIHLTAETPGTRRSDPGREGGEDRELHHSTRHCLPSSEEV